MNTEKMTNKLQELLSKAIELCMSNSNPELTINHCLKVIINDSDFNSFIKHYNINKENVNELIDKELNKLSHVSGDYQPSMNSNLYQVYTNANKLREQFNDEYLCSGVFLIELFDSNDCVIKTIRETYNINK